jgi:hypothetical protein
VNPREVAGLLAYVSDAWSVTGVGQNTTEIWAEACADVELEDARAAVRRLRDTLDKPPSIARFLEECKVVKRNRQPRIEPGRRVPDLPMERSSDIAAALSRGLKAASDLIPDHDHKPDPATGKRAGWVDCPACSTADARRPEVLAAIRSELDPEMED